MALNTAFLPVLLGAARVALGGGYMFAPKTVARLSFGPGPVGPDVTFTNKMFGTREAYLGATIIAASRVDSGLVKTLLLVAAAADSWDALSTFTTKGVSAHAKAAVSAVALTSALMGAGAALRLGRPSAVARVRI